MSRRVIVAVGLVVLVALAGCGQLTGSSTDARTTTTAPGSATPSASPSPTPTPTPTPAPTPTATPTATPTPAGTPVPTEGDLPAEVMATHVSALGNYSYVLNRYEFNKRNTASGLLWSNRKVVIRSDLQDKQVYANLSQTRVRNGTTSSVEVYLYGTANKTYRKSVGPSGNVSYQAANTSQPYVSLHRNSATAVLDTIVRDGVFENASTVQRDGRTFTRYEIRTLSFVNEVNVTIRDLSGSLLRDSEGIVHRARLKATLYYPEQNATITVDRRYSLKLTEDLDVQRPGWVETAVQRAG